MYLRLLPLLLLIGTLSCQNQWGCPDIQDNAILTDHPFSSDVYQTELIRLIQSDTRDITYYFESRVDDHLLVNVFGWGYCGRLKLYIEQEDHQSLKLQNHKGWTGAEMKGLKTRQTGTRLVYVSLDSLID